MEAISRGLNRAIEHLLFVLGATMAGVVAAQVFSRYLLNHSLFWSEELARYLLVWLSFLGATVAYRRGVNPGIDVVYSRLPPGLRRAAALVVHGSALVLFGVMIVHGAKFAHFVRLQTSPALGLPKWIPHAIIPLSGAVLAVHAVLFILQELKGGQEPKGGRHDG